MRVKETAQPCRGPSIEAERLDREVWAALRETLSQPEILVAQAEAWAAEQRSVTVDLSTIDARLTEAGRKHQRLAATATLDDDDAVAPMTDQLRQLAQEKRARMREWDEREALAAGTQLREEQLRNVAALCERAVVAFDTLTYEQRRMFLATVGLRVTVYRRDDPGHERWDGRGFSTTEAGTLEEAFVLRPALGEPSIARQSGFSQTYHRSSVAGAGAPHSRRPR